jgi:hypothetical protein
MKAQLAAATVAACLFASPAAAATYILGGPTGTPATVTIAPATGPSLTLSANRYTVAPNLLVSTTQFGSAANLSRSSIGLGVCTEGGSPASANSGECPQVDTNGSTNEILRASFSQASLLRNLQVSLIDNNDTLRLYGLGTDGTTLNLLGFVGTIAGGTGTGVGVNFTSTLVSNVNGRTFNVVFNPATPRFSTFFFTNNNDAVDGYRINSITAAIPEPGTWAMMIGGFGLAGMALRRRRRTERLAAA